MSKQEENVQAYNFNLFWSGFFAGITFCSLLWVVVSLLFKLCKT